MAPNMQINPYEIYSRWLRDHPCSTSFEQWMKLQNKRK